MNYSCCFKLTVAFLTYLFGLSYQILIEAPQTYSLQALSFSIFLCTQQSDFHQSLNLPVIELTVEQSTINHFLEPYLFDLLGHRMTLASR